ncbi:unnamed protein product [Rhizophagus irregularis]|nr:unnamed protein product [Rhizophagus irregularis]
MGSMEQNSNHTFIHDYPNSNIITTIYYESSSKSYLRKYIIHLLGIYPSNVKKTKKTSKNCPEYEIPDNYKVETTLEGYSIICETNYLSNGMVKFVLNWTDSQGIDQYISNNNSASGVAKNFLMLLNKKTCISGTILFAKDIEKESKIILKQQNFDNTKIRYIELEIGDEIVGIDLSEVNLDFTRVR